MGYPMYASNSYRPFFLFSNKVSSHLIAGAIPADYQLIYREVKMLSYHNDPAIKQKYLDRVHAHRIADEIEKGYFWKEGKGCAVGCTIHGNDHSKYEIELGIPKILARLEDGIFEGLPNDRAKLWPEQFLDSIKPGADLSLVWPQFAIWLLIDEKYGVINFAKNDSTKKSITEVANLYLDYKNTTREQWQSAAYAADAAADSAAYAVGASDADAAYAASDADAYAAAYAAAATYAYADADAAASDADASDADAAYAASDAYAAASAAAATYAYADAYAAAYAAAAYIDDVAAYAAAKESHRIAQADKLLELLRGAK